MTSPQRRTARDAAEPSTGAPAGYEPVTTSEIWIIVALVGTLFLIWSL